MEILKLNRKEWPYILVGVLGSIVVGFSTPVYAVIFGDVLGVLKPSSSQEEQDKAQAEGNWYAILFLVVGIVTGIAAFLQSFTFSVAGEGLTSRLRVMTFESILKQEVGWFDRHENSVGALTARLSGDASNVQGATGSRIGILLQAISTMVVSVVLSLYYQWKLGLTALFFVPLIFVATYIQVKNITFVNKTVGLFHDNSNFSRAPEHGLKSDSFWFCKRIKRPKLVFHSISNRCILRK